MTYDPNTPQAQPSPAATQAQIQTNFAQWAAQFVKNHSAMNNSNQGDHEAVIMEIRGLDPGVTQDLVALFCKPAFSTAGVQAQLFSQIKKFLPTPMDGTEAPNTGIQQTYNTVNLVGPNQFQTFLPNGYILYFGTVTSVGTVTLVPAPTIILCAIAMPNNLTTAGTPVPNTVSTNPLNNFQFDILSSTATGVYSFTWLVIAKA